LEEGRGGSVDTTRNRKDGTFVEKNNSGREGNMYIWNTALRTHRKFERAPTDAKKTEPVSARDLNRVSTQGGSGFIWAY